MSVAIVNPAGTVSPESKRKRDVLGLLIRCAAESIPTRPLAAGGRGLTQTQDTLSTHEKREHNDHSTTAAILFYRQQKETQFFCVIQLYLQFPPDTKGNVSLQLKKLCFYNKKGSHKTIF